MNWKMVVDILHEVKIDCTVTVLRYAVKYKAQN